MENIPKKRFFLNHKKSSAFVVSVAIHAVFLVAALTFVAVKVYVKPEQTFEVKDVKRPKMNLRKLQVPVKDHKKTQAPKLRHTIITKPKNKDINIKMPEVIGVMGGSGYGKGAGLGGLGFNFDIDLFGSSSRGTGNEFIGTFYDLKQTPEGELTDIGRAVEDEKAFNRESQLMACKIIKGFVGSGFNDARLKDFFQAPKLKYATTIMMPPMPADAAPKAFSVEDQVKGSYWVCHYKGQIAAPENGRYRFCGIADDILVVRVGRKVVLDASWPALIGDVSSWKSKDNDNRKFPMNGYKYGRVENFPEVFEQLDGAGAFDGNNAWPEAYNAIRINDQPLGGENYMRISSRMVIGDWMDLKKGQPMNVDILIGEIPGGEFSCRLLIEQYGKDIYGSAQSDAGERPIIPVFKTTPIDPKIQAQMELDPNEMTANGPAFGVLTNPAK